ncbi:hypothetical protein VQ042_22370 [Aurantimonas sp. A2-1-M11]|uniref:hypothetical protein n=1 Tax=Aurantimonas sp. A2-1-M11 TaxID=3113712 RepID=UPI002F92F1BB
MEGAPRDGTKIEILDEGHPEWLIGWYDADHGYWTNGETQIDGELFQLWPAAWRELTTAE